MKMNYSTKQCTCVLMCPCMLSLNLHISLCQRQAHMNRKVMFQNQKRVVGLSMDPHHTYNNCKLRLLLQLVSYTLEIRPSISVIMLCYVGLSL